MKDRIILVLKICIGVVFIFSAYSKLILPGIVEIILVDHGLFKERTTAEYFVRLLIACELTIGLLFFQKNYLRRIVIPGSLLFLIGFTIYLGYTGFILKDSQNCGCFGELIKMSPVESIVKNIVLIVLITILFRLVKSDSKKIILPIIILILSFAAVFVLSPVKNLKDFRFKDYSYFEGKGRVDLSNGEELIAVFNLECDHCQLLAKDLARMKKMMSWFPEMYALYFSEGQVSADSFKTITNFNFAYHIIGTKDFLNLVGVSPPRIYWLKNGEVKEFWDKDFIQNIALKFSNNSLKKK